jgi:hypothetical protein
MTNFLSFSLYGANALYSCGAIENARLSKEIYPDWQTVFYVGKSINESTIVELENYDAKIIRCEGNESASAMFWRFHAVDLPGANRVLVRDADSRISAREAAAVSEWIASGKSLHIIRDHPWHSQNILGGLWGVQGPEALGIVSEHLPNTLNLVGEYGDDQNFVSRIIYPAFMGDMLAHDSFYRFTKITRPLGPRVNGEFIGEVIQCDGKYDPSLRQAAARYEALPPLKLLLRWSRIVAAVRP